jgi:hypothetical protein
VGVKLNIFSVLFWAVILQYLHSNEDWLFFHVSKKTQQLHAFCILNWNYKASM